MKISTLGPIKEINSGTDKVFKVYSVQFEGSEDWIDINQKPATPAPTVGQELEGEIEKTNWGYRFKKAASGFSGGFQKGGSTDPATRTSIERQTALTRAVEAVYNCNTLKGADLSAITLSDYSNAIMAAAAKFATYLETGKAVLVDPRQNNETAGFDQAIADLGGEEVESIPYE